MFNLFTTHEKLSDSCGHISLHKNVFGKTVSKLSVALILEIPTGTDE